MEPEESKRIPNWTLGEMMFYKLDRTLAVLFIGAIGVYTIHKGVDFINVTTSVITALGILLGVKVGKN